jgi:lipopolysaccharide export system protein LptA
MYFYARSKATNVLKSIPGKIGYDIKQTANGFQFSKSDGKRTLFTVQASDVKQFKLDGNAELHKVSIIVYGRDSSRFDQIYGDDFSYNQKTGDVSAKGEVQIDLVANPAGLASPDQSTPKELKNPIHLKTSDLVFNRETGNAWTDARVELRTPQASGWAVGVRYSGKTNSLTLSSQIHVEMSGSNAAILDAQHGTITNDPRTIVLEHPHLRRESGTLRADEATIYLDADNQVERVFATGDVTSDAKNVKSKSSDPANASSDLHARADKADLDFLSGQELLRTATLTGNVHLEQVGAQSMQGDAGRVIVDFAGQNEVRMIHALDGAHLVQGVANDAQARASSSQNFDLTASSIDFKVADGKILQHAETSGPARITITQQTVAANASQAPTDRTVVTAGKFNAEFSEVEGRTHLASVHGSPEARIVSSSTGQPDRISTSDSVDATFLPQGGIQVVTQTGNVSYSDSQPPDKRVQAFSTQARYTPADQMLVLSGSPRILSAGMQTTANSVRINRATGDAFADGDVKSTYSDLKEQPNGALLASSSPIHVTANSMTAHNNPGIALYSGKARLWQDANVIEAPTIEFDRNRRFVTATGTAAHPVQTILIQKDDVQKHNAQQGSAPSEAVQPQNSSAKKGQLDKSDPISITGQKLTYSDSERRVHYEGGVVAQGAEFTASAKTVDAFLVPHSQTAAIQAVSGPGQLDHMVAEGGVVIHQPKRRAEGDKLVYTASDDKFVLTGGPPSIFDAEQGKITGVSLTFFRRDDRVLVEGEASNSVVTTTRVAR